VYFSSKNKDIKKRREGVGLVYKARSMKKEGKGENLYLHKRRGNKRLHLLRKSGELSFFFREKKIVKKEVSSGKRLAGERAFFARQEDPGGGNFKERMEIQKKERKE